MPALRQVTLPAKQPRHRVGDGYCGTAQLSAIEEFLPKYNADLVNKLSRYFSPDMTLLEFGAGRGTLAALWSDKTQKKPHCVEIDRGLLTVLRGRGFQSFSSLSASAAPYDGIYSSNVLEHIADDSAALRALQSALKPDAKLAIYVPAFMCLYSDLDAAVGHYRRYRRQDLVDKLERAGFVIVECHYVDSLGFFAAYALRLFGYKTGLKLGSNRNLGRYDRLFYPISRLIDQLGAKHLFGKNLLIVAKRAT